MNSYEVYKCKYYLKRLFKKVQQITAYYIYILQKQRYIIESIKV